MVFWAKPGRALADIKVERGRRRPRWPFRTPPLLPRSDQARRERRRASGKTRKMGIRADRPFRRLDCGLVVAAEIMANATWFKRRTKVSARGSSLMQVSRDGRPSLVGPSRPELRRALRVQLARFGHCARARQPQLVRPVIAARHNASSRHERASAWCYRARPPAAPMSAERFFLTLRSISPF